MSFTSTGALFNDALPTARTAANNVLVLAQTYGDKPIGPEFGKASPIGLLILVLLAVAVIFAGWSFHRRYSRFRRRSLFAQRHDIDPFDEEKLDKAMREAGIQDRRKKSKF